MQKIRLITIALDRERFIGGVIETSGDLGVYRGTITDLKFYRDDRRGSELHVCIEPELEKHGKRWFQSAAGSTDCLRSPYRKPLRMSQLKDGRIVIVPTNKREYFSRAVLYPKGMLKMPPVKMG